MTAATHPVSARAPFAGGRRQDRAAQRVAVAVAVAFHAALFAALWSYAPTRDALKSMAPIVIDMIKPKVEEPPPPPPEPPKPVVKPRLQPQPVPKQAEPPPIVTAPSEAPSTFVAPPPPEPKPLPPIDAVPAPEPAPPPPVTPPRFNADYLQNPAPPYPAFARRMREQGKVVLRVFVSADGLAEKVELRTSSGSPRLDQSAVDTVKGWKFVPARQGDQKIGAWVLVPIAFTLEN